MRELKVPGTRKARVSQISRPCGGRGAGGAESVNLLVSVIMACRRCKHRNLISSHVEVLDCSAGKIPLSSAVSLNLVVEPLMARPAHASSC